jgi:hypothetical protein
MLSFIPLHLSALERSPPLLEWIKSWAGPSVEALAPEDWFERDMTFEVGQPNAVN